jgi:restriction system protein
MIPSLILLAIIILIVFLFRQPAIKGKAGEIAVSMCLKLMLDKPAYRVIDNVTIPDDKDGTTQIDHIVVSKYGIFVIETKNMKGWIYGDEHSPKWTQVFNRNSKFPFQNPLRQNYKHIMCLAQLLDLPKESFIHLIVFVGDCRIKTRDKIPANVVTGGISMKNFILSRREELFDESTVTAICEAIESGRLTKGLKTNRDHVNHVKEIVAEEETTDPVCPKCGADMVLRTAMKGDNAGNQFWGCSKFPKCRGIVEAD